MDQPANRSYAVKLHFRKQRFGHYSTDARSLVVGPDGDDHEIAVLGQWPETFVLDAVVRGHRYDFAVVISDDDLTIERRLFDVVTPADETRRRSQPLRRATATDHRRGRMIPEPSRRQT